MEKVLEGENFVVIGLSSIIVKSEFDAVHVRTSAFSRDNFEKWKSIFCELSLCSLNIWKPRPYGDGHDKIVACHYICHHGMQCHKVAKKTYPG